MNRRVTLIISAISICLVITFTIMGLSWRKFLSAPMVPADCYMDYIVTRGSTLKKVAFDLQRQPLMCINRTNKSINYNRVKAYLFILYAHLIGQANAVKVGEYQFEGGSTPVQLLREIVDGDVVKHHLTIIEGWDFRRLVEALAKATRLEPAVINNPPNFITTQLQSTYTNPEGLFFPATYTYVLGNTDLDILKMAYTKMLHVLNKEWQTRDINLSYKTPYEALIVASMIEKEAKLDEERPLIAGVILNRLNKKMRLQIDATVIYALGTAYSGHLSHQDMSYQSPYNTYLYSGLPPTPIAMPSLASIHAALHPTPSDKLYYVARGDGRHYFSATWQEHREALKNYLASKKADFIEVSLIKMLNYYLQQYQLFNYEF